MCEEALVMTVAKRQLGAWILEPDSPDLPAQCSVTSSVTNEESSIRIIVVGVKLGHS